MQWRPQTRPDPGRFDKGFVDLRQGASSCRMQTSIYSFEVAGLENQMVNEVSKAYGWKVEDVWAFKQDCRANLQEECLVLQLFQRFARCRRPILVVHLFYSSLSDEQPASAGVLLSCGGPALYRLLRPSTWHFHACPPGWKHQMILEIRAAQGQTDFSSERSPMSSMERQIDLLPRRGNCAWLFDFDSALGKGLLAILV